MHLMDLVASTVMRYQGVSRAVNEALHLNAGDHTSGPSADTVILLLRQTPDTPIVLCHSSCAEEVPGPTRVC